MISHTNVLETLWDVEKTCFHHTLVEPLVQSSMCLTANSQIPFWQKFDLKIVSTVILSPPLSQLEQLPVSCKRVSAQY